MRLKSLIILVVGFMLVSCSPSYETQRGVLEKLVAWYRVGSSSDVWIIKHNMFGDNEKVGLVFGFLNDYEFCREVAELYMKRYPADNYSCALAN
jgi:hypothetical protein